jgi:hypothetical protein
VTSEPEDLAGFLDAALVDRPALEQAKGVLVSALCVAPEDAHAELRRIAQRHEVRLTDLAGALVEAAAGGRPGDPLLRKVLWQEWGERFPACE